MRAHRRAFTLIELIIVLMVMGILSGMAAPRYLDALASVRVDAAAKRITADLRHSQLHAETKSVLRAVTFGVGSDWYQVQGVQDIDHVDRVYRVTLSEEGYGCQIGLTGFGGGDTVTFNEFGQPVVGGTVVVTSGNHSRTIHVDVSGLIEVLP